MIRYTLDGKTILYTLVYIFKRKHTRNTSNVRVGWTTLGSVNLTLGKSFDELWITVFDSMNLLFFSKTPIFWLENPSIRLLMSFWSDTRPTFVLKSRKSEQMPIFYIIIKGFLTGHLLFSFFLPLSFIKL